MATESKVLGILTPVGGGDPIPLRKGEVVVGRRPSCDIRLDFANVSGKHCMFRFVNSVWHVRDLGSTNGTSLNGTAISSEQTVMPDDQIGVASHSFTIVYEPGGPVGSRGPKGASDDEAVEAPARKSLMEMAGIKGDNDRARPPSKRSDNSEGTAITPSPKLDDLEGFGDSLPDHAKKAPKPKVEVSDDDFFKLFEDSLDKPKP